MFFTHHADNSQTRKNRRIHHERRSELDRRQEIRFEPGKPNRRKISCRRRKDTDPWHDGALEH